MAGMWDGFMATTLSMAVSRFVTAAGMVARALIGVFARRF
jgi:hypothetical protein